MSMVSSSSPEPSIDDHPQTSAFLSTNDLLLLPDLKVLPKEVVQAESIHYSPACQDQGIVDYIHPIKDLYCPNVFCFFLFDKYK